MVSAIIIFDINRWYTADARAVIGTEFREYTHREDPEQFGDHVSITTNREMKMEEEHSFAKGDFVKFELGEAVIARQGKGWVHVQIKMLDE